MQGKALHTDLGRTTRGPVADGCRLSILRLAVVSYDTARWIYSKSTTGAPLQVVRARSSETAADAPASAPRSALIYCTN